MDDEIVAASNKEVYEYQQKLRSIDDRDEQNIVSSRKPKYGNKSKNKLSKSKITCNLKSAQLNDKKNDKSVEKRRSNFTF